MFISNAAVVPEKSMKYNVGIEATLFKGLNLTVDAFLDKRSNILTLDNSKMAYYGKQYVFSNVGEMTNRGFEASASYAVGHVRRQSFDGSRYRRHPNRYHVFSRRRTGKKKH